MVVHIPPTTGGCLYSYPFTIICMSQWRNKKRLLFGEIVGGIYDTHFPLS